MEGYTEFIGTLLIEKTTLTQEFVSNMMSKETNALQFKIALTDASSGKEYNYQLLEFIGDKIVGSCFGMYLASRMPAVVREGTMTTIHHELTSNKYLAVLSRDYGFDKYAVLGDSTRERFKDRNLQDESYSDFMGDLFEAFFGAIYKVIMNEGLGEGVVIQICYQITSSFLDKRKIPLNLIELKPDNTRLNEIYPKLGWPGISKMEREESLPSGEHKHIIYGYPVGDLEKKTRIILGEGIAKDKKMAKEIAAAQAIHKLVTYYGVEEIIPNPYQYSSSKSKKS